VAASDEDSIAIARRLVAAHPAAKLPCPICAASLKAENLDHHLAKVHPGASAPTGPWRGKGALGVFPCSLAIVGDAIVLRHTLGLFTRTVPLPTGIEAGSLWRSQPDAITAGYADDFNTSSVDVKAGRYVRLECPRSRVGITVGCRGGGALAGHWEGWRQGARRKSVDLMIGREAMVGLEYALAGRGLLVPRIA